MNEVKKPKKPLIYYYIIVMAILLMFNLMLMPLIAERSIKDVDYGQFMTMTESKKIIQVEIQYNQILFTDKTNSTVYRTGLMNDPGLVERLHESGAKFTSEISRETSPVLTFLLSWILPIILFIGIGQYISKKLMDKAGGGNSMMFGMGKSNAKILSLIHI